MTICARIETHLDAIQITDPQRQRILQRARDLSQACGCTAALVALLATAAVLFLRQQANGDHSLVSWSGLAWTLGAAVVGKLIGLATARARLIALERRLAEAARLKRSFLEFV